MSLDVLSLGTEGVTAPPRTNGELTFAAPWESRSFAMALALAQQGLFTLDEFRDHLIEAIGRWEDADHGDEPYHYYRQWQEALEAILAAKQTIAQSTIRDRIGVLAQRPHGHDH